MTQRPHRRVLFIIHDDTDPPGLMGRWAVDRGFTVDTFDIRPGHPLPNPADYDLVVPLGSEESVADPDVPFVPTERDFLRAAIQADVAVLGVCFGGQLLASALGADVRPAEQAEVGWYTVRTLAPAILPEGPWFSWHVDRFDVPDGGELLAEGPVGPQAFRLGRQVGLQFHPEVDAAMVETWTRGGAEQLRALGVDTTALVAESLQHEPAIRARAYALFDGLATVLFQ